MANKVSYLGLEELQASAERKWAMSKALLEQGMARENMVSPLQVLGKWAEVFAGRNLGKKADNAQSQLAAALRERRTQANQAAFAPNATNDIANIISNPYTDPKVAEALLKREKPSMFMRDGKQVLGASDGLGNINPVGGGYTIPDIKNIGQMAVDMNQVKPGEVLPGDPGPMGIRGQDGTIQVNQAALLGKLAEGGQLASGTQLPPQVDPSLRRDPQFPVAPPEAMEELRTNPNLFNDFVAKFGPEQTRKAMGY